MFAPLVLFFNSFIPFFFLILRFREVCCMWWSKCDTAVWLWSSYRDWRQLLRSEDGSLLSIQTHSATHVLAGGVQLDRCGGFSHRYFHPCWFVCFFEARLQKNNWTDFHETCWWDEVWVREELIKYCWGSRSGGGSRWAIFQSFYWVPREN